MAQEPQQSEPVEEFEREPVPPRALLGLKSYVGMFAGEHVAGTELTIGPLFLAAGVSAFDFVVGLLVGNLLAVLSWTFFTAPIATRCRLTLYYQLERICGRKLVTAYSVANGVMFTVLAGAMVTVSTTALGVHFNFSMPELTDTLPTGLGWVVAVLLTGALFSLTAAYGYRFLARFANIAAPWMVMGFVAFGVIGLHQMGLDSPGDFWEVASTAIWTGGAPQAGQVKFTFWHVMFFAWFCNMAWHIGMADLSVFRFAKKAWYGLASAAGMYIGHFMAWIAASTLYAVQLEQDPSNTAVLPGPLAYRACGLAGLVASVCALFPIVPMRLLDFVALWAMILMPMGAVVFVDFWLLPRFGLRRDFAQVAGRSFNWAAGVAWLLSLVFCVTVIGLYGRDKLYFVSLPGWFVTALVYIGASKAMQKGSLASTCHV